VVLVEKPSVRLEIDIIRQPVGKNLITRRRLFLHLGTSGISLFISPMCSDPYRIGPCCNVSIAPCDVLKPCQNAGVCSNDAITSHGYGCYCEQGFCGNECESHSPLCTSDTCWNYGLHLACFFLQSTNFKKIKTCSFFRDLFCIEYNSIMFPSTGLDRHLLRDYDRLLSWRHMLQQGCLPISTWRISM
jgi:hypothetical protein